MFLLSLFLTASQPDPKLLMSCDDFSWLLQGVVESELLSPGQKIEFIGRFMQATDPACFDETKKETVL